MKGTKHTPEQTVRILRERERLLAKELYSDWCRNHNHHRPDSALSDQPPAAFAKAYSQP